MLKKLDVQQRDLIIAQRALAWSDIARRVAHEINNPLTPIQLAAERLKKKFSDQVVSDKEGFQRHLEIISRHTNDIRNILSEFVNFAKLPSPSFQKVEIIKILKDLVESRKIVHEKIDYTLFVEEICGTFRTEE